MKYDKITLPYKFNDLEPYIDGETIEIHYSKHLQSYVNNLNSIVEKNQDFFHGKALEEILSDTNNIPEYIKLSVINQGGGVFNHNLYFSLLSPNAKLSPQGDLLKDINNTFGSVENLKEQISNASLRQFGSGYGWLVINKYGVLQVMMMPNQDNPLSIGAKPILTIDVWEHAYYLKYKNLRGDYVKNIWNIIDWSAVEKLYLNYKK
ncbi:superoxide dismutase [Clostridium bornimense]|uniref:superoxide dismutase n=1 Tax=Clostridium bornimense TaxID=1216932 RepID=UPI001C125B11|nr:superoxide dismutase [Clostridium bornimense]MBU5316601.1 superoxide dismutase [Clostridium bornimense]